jgi:hypothetical protein
MIADKCRLSEATDSAAAERDEKGSFSPELSVVARKDGDRNGQSGEQETSAAQAPHEGAEVQTTRGCRPSHSRSDVACEEQGNRTTDETADDCAHDVGSNAANQRRAHSKLTSAMPTV